jgi:hypothetical protein
MTGVPCIELTWETFKEQMLNKTIYYFENKTTVWVIWDGFLIIANKPKDECGSYKFLKNSIPAIGFSNYWTK